MLVLTLDRELACLGAESLVFLLFYLVLDVLLETFNTDNLRVFQLDIVHDLSLHLLLQLDLGFHFSQLLLELAALARDFRVVHVALNQHLALLLPHSHLPLRLREQLLKSDLLGLEVILNFDDRLVVVGVFKLVPHRFDLALYTVLFQHALLQVFVLQRAVPSDFSF